MKESGIKKAQVTPECGIKYFQEWQFDIKFFYCCSGAV
jgi:hypothetical protein